MFNFLGEQGLYPAISITGNSCQLNCAHCQGKLLKDMIPATTPEALIEVGLRLAKDGNIGCLISGGSNLQGKLPWQQFATAIKQIKAETNLKVSVHTGIIDEDSARALKEAGVDQVLIDVIGDDQTLRKVYNLDLDLSCVYDSLRHLYEAGHCVVPHILIGIHYGEIRGEYNALNLLKNFPLANLVLVILNPLPGTPMVGTRKVAPSVLSRIIQKAKEEFPDARIALGCARPRDKTCFSYEKVAIDLGIDKIAFPTEAAIAYARNLNLEVIYEKTCCSW